MSTRHFIAVNAGRHDERIEPVSPVWGKERNGRVPVLAFGHGHRVITKWVATSRIFTAENHAAATQLKNA